MANQVRELIEQSVRTYVEFIQRFKKDQYPPPSEIITREYDPDSQFEDSFICVKLTIDGTKIVFEDDLEEKVQPELENIIDAIVKQSCNLPRPENSWSRGDKMHLWVVPEDDEVMDDAKKTVSKIIEENRKIVETAVDVYQDYMWILDQGPKVQEFVDTKNTQNYDRDKFQEKINSYQACIDKIRDEMPHEIRMNMFLVECKDINDLLCERLEGLIMTILNKVTEYVFAIEATKISSEVKIIKEQLAARATETKQLCENRQRLEDVMNKDAKRLKTQYLEIIEWHQLLCRNPR
jgi:hypothetical protein